MINPDELEHSTPRQPITGWWGMAPRRRALFLDCMATYTPSVRGEAPMVGLRDAAIAMLRGPPPIQAREKKEVAAVLPECVGELWEDTVDGEVVRIEDGHDSEDPEDGYRVSVIQAVSGALTREQLEQDGYAGDKTVQRRVRIPRWRRIADAPASAKAPADTRLQRLRCALFLRCLSLPGVCTPLDALDHVERVLDSLKDQGLTEATMSELLDGGAR